MVQDLALPADGELDIVLEGIAQGGVIQTLEIEAAYLADGDDANAANNEDQLRLAIPAAPPARIFSDGFDG